VLIKALSPNGWPEGFRRRSDFIDHIRDHVLPSLLNYDPRLSELTLDSLAERLFDEVRDSGGIALASDRFAGEYFTAVPPHIAEFRKGQLSSNPIHALASNIGVDRFFSDVFAGYRQDPDIDRSELDPLPPPPLDNRTITIEPAQTKKIDAPLTELIQQVEADNGLPDVPGFRERMLGQLKAGREMLLSGCIRAQLFYWVLLKALGELVEKYGQKAIGVAAARLIELLVEQLFKA
jgi:hypothetical protein